LALSMVAWKSLPALARLLSSGTLVRSMICTPLWFGLVSLSGSKVLAATQLR
jgi:hypothetical protein